MKARLLKAFGFLLVLVAVVVIDQHMGSTNSPDVMQADIFWWIRKVVELLL